MEASTFPRQLRYLGRGRTLSTSSSPAHRGCFKIRSLIVGRPTNGEVSARTVRYFGLIGEESDMGVPMVCNASKYSVGTYHMLYTRVEVLEYICHLLWLTQIKRPLWSAMHACTLYIGPYHLLSTGTWFRMAPSL